jgi:hypothetical protein
MKTKLDFRTPANRRAGLAAWHRLQQATCPAHLADIAMQWMAYCDRTNRLYYTPEN